MSAATSQTDTLKDGKGGIFLGTSVAEETIELQPAASRLNLMSVSFFRK